MACFIRLALVIFLSGGIAVASAIAQENKVEPQSGLTLMQSVPIKEKENVSDKKVAEVIAPLSSKPSDPYVKSNLQNIANAYWAFGVLDVNKKDDIDDYLIVSNCDVYLGYYKNEFEWANIRDAAKKHVVANKLKFPRKFEFTYLVYLDRYSVEKQEFDIAEASQIRNVNKIKMSHNDFQDTKCEGKVSLEGFPFNVFLKVPLSFSLTTIPVKDGIAKEYITFAEKSYGAFGGKYESERKQRPAYVRLRASFEQFVSFTPYELSGVAAVMSGSLDRIDVFADEDESILLFSKEFERLDTGLIKKADKPELEEVR